MSGKPLNFNEKNVFPRNFLKRECDKIAFHLIFIFVFLFLTFLFEFFWIFFIRVNIKANLCEKRHRGMQGCAKDEAIEIFSWKNIIPDDLCSKSITNWIHLGESWIMKNWTIWSFIWCTEPRRRQVNHRLMIENWFFCVKIDLKQKC